MSLDSQCPASSGILSSPSQLSHADNSANGAAPNPWLRYSLSEISVSPSEERRNVIHTKMKESFLAECSTMRFIFSAVYRMLTRFMFRRSDGRSDSVTGVSLPGSGEASGDADVRSRAVFLLT